MAVDDKTELSRTEARAGQSNHIARYVLAISLALVIVIFAVLVFSAL